MSIRPRSVIWLFVPAISGCNGCDPAAELPHLLEAEDATPTAVWVAEAIGTSPVDATLFATTGLGAPIAAGDILVTSEASAAASVTPSSEGWATVAVTSAAPGGYGLTGTAGTATGAGTTWVVAAQPGAIDAPAFAGAGAPELMSEAGRGVAWNVGGEVWWNNFAGGVPIRVLALPEAVTDLYGVQADTDGITDLVVISAQRVVVLRGRDGGLSWGGGWSAVEGASISGAAVADATGDSIPDLTVALAVDGGTTVLQLAGDGVWGYSPFDALELDYTAHAVSVDDIDDNGVGEVTLVTEDGLLRRYTKLEDSWAATMSGSEFDLEIAAGAHLLPAQDVTGDGVEDFIAYGPSIANGNWYAWVITVGADTPARYPIVGDGLAAAWLGFAVGDLSGDGIADLLYTSPSVLGRGIWQETGTFETSTFSVSKYSTVPTERAIALIDGDADGVLDVALAGDTVRLLIGEHPADTTGDTGAADEDPWSPRVGDADVYGIDLLVEPELADISGDLVTDVVTLVLPSGGTAGVALQGLRGVAATDVEDEVLQSGGSVTLTGSGSALDLALCGDRAFALYEEADEAGIVGTWLARAHMAAGLGPTLDGAAIAVTGSRVVCGNFALGEVAVIDDAGSATFVDVTGVVGGVEAVGAYGDVAAVDADGDGVDALVTCAEAGCWIGAADIDGDGQLDLVEQDSTGTTVTLATGAVSTSWAGATRLDDADGDGVADVIVGDRGAVAVYRAMDGALSPGVASWTWRPVGDVARFGDLSGDGLPDLFLYGADPDPDSAAGDDWIGTLLYLRASPRD